jgi:hypothetical protein
MSANNSPPGLINPTQVGMIGANPQQSAHQTLVNMNQKQTSLGNAVGGKKRKGGAVPVPQFQMPYPVQNGPGQDPNSQAMTNSSTLMQRHLNAGDDALAANMSGGSTKWGGTKWGCYSGGIRRKTKTRKTRRTKTRRAKKRNTKRNRK